ncbi:DUF3124 domain-containing protein [Thermodesulfobacteriota bacterium]
MAKISILSVSAALIVTVLAGAASSGSCPERSSGQTWYVSIYSHVYSGPKSRPMNLTATLSVRNTDRKHPITITTVDYYDSNGKLVRSYLERPFQLDKLATTRFIVKASDTTGGSGANFIVTWHSRTEVDVPIVEAVHVSTASGQGISFVTHGQVLSDEAKK